MKSNQVDIFLDLIFEFEFGIEFSFLFLVGFLTTDWKVLNLGFPFHFLVDLILFVVYFQMAKALKNHHPFL